MGEKPARWYAPNDEPLPSHPQSLSHSHDVSWYSVIHSWLVGSPNAPRSNHQRSLIAGDQDRSFNLSVAANRLTTRGKRAVRGRNLEHRPWSGSSSSSLSLSCSEEIPRRLGQQCSGNMPSKALRRSRAEIGECQWCGQRTHFLVPVPVGFGNGDRSVMEPREIDGSTVSFFNHDNMSHLEASAVSGHSGLMTYHIQKRGQAICTTGAIAPVASDLSSAMLGALAGGGAPFGWVTANMSQGSSQSLVSRAVWYVVGQPMTIPNVVDHGICLHCFPDENINVGFYLNPKRSPADALRVLRSVAVNGTISIPEHPGRKESAWPAIIAALDAWPEDATVQSEGCSAVEIWMKGQDQVSPKAQKSTLELEAISGKSRKKDRIRDSDNHDSHPHKFTETDRHVRTAAAIDAVVTALRTHPNSRKVQLAALECLVCASSTSNSRGLVASSVAWRKHSSGDETMGGVETIVASLKRYVDGMQQIAGTWRDKQERQRSLTSSNVCRDADVVEKACWVLRNLAVPPNYHDPSLDSSTLILIRDNGINHDSLGESFRQYNLSIGRVSTDVSSCSLDAEFPCEYSEEIEVVHPDHRPTIVTVGGINAVLAALMLAAPRGAWGTERGVARNACAILANLTYKRNPYKEMVVTKGGVEVLLAVLKGYPDEVDTVEPALRALHNLMGVPDPVAGDRVRDQVVGIAPHCMVGLTFDRNLDFDVADLGKLMETHRSSVTVQREVCALLADVTFQRERGTMKLLSSTETISAIFRAMRDRPNDVGLQRCAVATFRWCTEWECSTMHFRQLYEKEEGAGRLLQNAAMKFPNQCQKRVRIIKWKLLRNSVHDSDF